MARIETRGKAVKEVAAYRGHTVDDFQVLPAERDNPCPRALFAGSLPEPIVSLAECAADRPGTFVAPDLAGERRVLNAQPRNVCAPRRPERAPRQQDANRFEEVTLTLRVGPTDDVQPRGRTIGKGAIISNVQQVDPSDLHPI